MSRFRRAAAAVVVLLTGVLAAPTAAQATTLPWNSAPCITGGLYDIVTDTHQNWYVVRGSATQCAPTVEYGGFRVVVYKENAARGFSAGWNARQFPSAEPGESVWFGAAALQRKAGNYGLCLVAAGDKRIDCASATISKASAAVGSPPVLWPISVDDPLVAKEFDADPYTAAPNPAVGNGHDDNPHTFCGTCW
ncbi:hypothetical protein [Paractinoplanes rishiriensis]|uniref:Secreted protein n=1 Tax=Paractinoplanes rishiriensis TaxID=1050105 RepID=A0A919MTE8_9ACTN|nr:hypothetical protein [Actinoplanes rishiriensis]GIE99186.1 hypothetical protein Ari01nite_66510 [Actinoplanes rishiriensis]